MTEDTMVFQKPSGYKNINCGSTISKTMVKKSVEIAGNMVVIAIGV